MRGGQVSRLEELGREDARLITLQGELLDYSGHVTRGLPRGRALELLEEIQGIRRNRGWRALDMAGRWRRRPVGNR
jgi:chromosome segregation ATPase